jgi:glycolate oxidase FAD binding subunit
MPAAVDNPIARRVAPSSREEAAGVVRDCFESAMPVYPLGGETSLGFGLPIKMPGVGIATTSLKGVIDFPARDMTITAETGVTLAELLRITSAEGLQFPVDVPLPEKATLGGVVATNWNGPRRYGCGLVRDYVIGIRAVDGTGTEFKGGGRVVKNVAGYDFCKLLTGSMGTLGVITEVTLKLRPIAEERAWVLSPVSDLAAAEAFFAQLVDFPSVPACICLLAGKRWVEEASLSGILSPMVAVGFEGSNLDVEWSLGELSKMLPAARIELKGYDALLQRLTHFPADEKAPLVIRAALVPSGVMPFTEAVLKLDPSATVLAHAGSGTVYVAFSEMPAGGLSKSLVGNLHGVAQQQHGNVVILSNPSGAEMTHQAVFGGAANWELMRAVKEQLDPKNLLNPGKLFSL